MFTTMHVACVKCHLSCVMCRSAAPPRSLCNSGSPDQQGLQATQLHNKWQCFFVVEKIIFIWGNLFINKDLCSFLRHFVSNYHKNLVIILGYCSNCFDRPPPYLQDKLFSSWKYAPKYLDLCHINSFGKCTNPSQIIFQISLNFGSHRRSKLLLLFPTHNAMAAKDRVKTYLYLSTSFVDIKDKTECCECCN